MPKELVPNPTVREILADWLEEKGYDGLYGARCACAGECLFACFDEDDIDVSFLSCRAGYLSGDCIRPTKRPWKWAIDASSQRRIVRRKGA